MSDIPVSSLRVDPAFAARLPAADTTGLREDVRQRGVLLPLLVTRDGLVLDGHRRLAVARELGFERVPVIHLDLNGTAGWQRAVAMAVNLHRRHLNEAQRVALGTSLERIEREAAAVRQGEGRAKGGKAGGPREGKGRRKREPLPPHGGGQAGHEGETTSRVAAAVGVSRNTYERTKAVLERGDPETAQAVLAGRLSVAAAHQRLRRDELAAAAKRAAEEHVPGLYRGALSEVPAGLYRCLYLDPPWKYDDSGSRGAAAGHYETMTPEELAALDVPRLAYFEGCHLWLWTTWPKIRDGVPHRLLEAWGFRWVGEASWIKDRMGTGHYLRGITEILILAVRGNQPLLVADQAGIIEAPQGAHSQKPEEARSLIERCSPGPRLELFGRTVPETWDGWGQQSLRPGKKLP